MTNTSATGGYLAPTTTQALPGGLTLNQFIQSVLVGLSGLSGTLVRPDWQKEPPKSPDIGVDWLAFGVREITPDTFAYTAEQDSGDGGEFQRQEGLEVLCHFYGDNALAYAGLVSDGFQLQQNLAGLRTANMGFTETSRIIHSPELINERYRDRFIMSVFLRRQIQRVYPLLQILSANGTIHTVLGTEEYLLNFDVEAP